VSVAVIDRSRADGLVGWLASTDHKRIAVLTLLTALVFFVGSGILAVLVRTELLEPGMQLMSKDSYNQVFTMHGSGMIYLVVTPLALALGVYLVPLQVGAAEIAAPRVVLLGYWLYLVGGVTMFLGFAASQGAGKDGWTAFAPLSDSTNTPGSGMDFWVIGVFLAVAGMFLQGGAVLATVLRLRAPGMTMLRLPVFCWSMLASCLMVVTSFPVLLAAMALLEYDRVFGGIFDGRHGAEGWQHLFWFYGHPVVYVMFFPFVGAVAEVAAVFSARRFFGYTGTTLSFLLFAALSMSVWAHHMFVTGTVKNQYFSLTSTMLIVPAGLEYFAIVGTLIGGAIVLSTAMLFAVGFLLLFLLGGLSGIFVGSPPLDYHVHDSYFVVAHFHYTLFAGSLFGFFAAVYYWFPKLTGRFLREGLGKLQFALLFVGTNLTFFPMFILGYDGMPRRVADYSPSSGFQGWNDAASAGAYVVTLGLFVFFVNIAVSLRRPRFASADPWGGQTLEWWTSSPPPRFNFTSLPPRIRSFAPLLDLKEAERSGP
jgi:cytochrome c oxidase subunit 1